MDVDGYYASIGAGRPAWATDGVALLERQWLEPTLELNGLWGGYLGPGHENRDPRHGARQDHLPPRSRPGPGCSSCGDRGSPAAALPGRLHGSRSRDDGQHATRAYAIDPANTTLAAAEAVLRAALRPRRPCASPWAPPCRSPSCSSACSGWTRCSSASPRRTRTITRPNEFFRLDRFRDGLRCWAALLMRLGSHEGVVRTARVDPTSSSHSPRERFGYFSSSSPCLREQRRCVRERERFFEHAAFADVIGRDQDQPRVQQVAGRA